MNAVAVTGFALRPVVVRSPLDHVDEVINLGVYRSQPNRAIERQDSPIGLIENFNGNRQLVHARHREAPIAPDVPRQTGSTAFSLVLYPSRQSSTSHSSFFSSSSSFLISSSFF